ncbi:unnamed protein product [Didymodactylos carnosus]|uniref:Uncharacterized protein n=1 Tax=Didymodactylos carnosus TaxID=1234261 RepID=A0A8S2EZB4_9BILA|nr:unnamed protein product [Didymodactylos carnosus]CAF4104614.1 unnamed protein product [Didymodactylos carnosus]
MSALATSQFETRSHFVNIPPYALDIWLMRKNTQIFPKHTANFSKTLGLDEQRLTDLIQAVELIYVNKTMSNVIEKTVEEFYAHHSFQTFIRACLIPMMYLLKRQQNLDLIVNNIVLELMDTTNGLNQDILKNVRTLTALCHPIDRDALKHQLLRLSNDEYRQFYRDTSESTRSLKQILFEAIRDGNMTDYFRIYSEFIEICKYRTQLTRIDVYGSSSKELFSLQGKLYN